MSVEEHFPDTKPFVVNYKKMSTPGSVSKHCLGFSYISSEDYGLDRTLIIYNLKIRLHIQQ